jgi:hypothetical protein
VRLTGVTVDDRSFKLCGETIGDPVGEEIFDPADLADQTVGYMLLGGVWSSPPTPRERFDAGVKAWREAEARARRAGVAVPRVLAVEAAEALAAGDRDDRVELETAWGDLGDFAGCLDRLTLKKRQMTGSWRLAPRVLARAAMRDARPGRRVLPRTRERRVRAVRRSSAARAGPDPPEPEPPDDVVVLGRGSR